MDIDKTVNHSTWVTVGMVAAFAAIVSYTHIRDLALRNGYDAVTSYMLPLSVDGLILGGSLLLITAARNHLEASVAKAAVWLGILATIAANVAYGLPHGVLGAIVSAWPAVAFIVIVEAVMQLAKRKRATRKSAENTVRHAHAAHSSRGQKVITAAPPSVPDLLPPPLGKGKVPSIRAIRDELSCGQPVATDLQRIMRDENVTLDRARAIRNERKEVNAS